MKDAKEYAESIGAIVVETSAKNAINIEELFQGISKYLKLCFQLSFHFCASESQSITSLSSDVELFFCVNLCDAADVTSTTTHLLILTYIVPPASPKFCALTC